jgi:uncharacterized protein YcfJ
MKTHVLSAALLAMGAYAGLAAAQQGYGDTAKVVSATPVTERVTENRRDCRVEVADGYTERVRGNPTPPPTGAGAVIGSIIGGVIGHQFGYSGGATAAGAVVGSLVGNQVERDTNAANAGDIVVERTQAPREVERCRMVPETRDRVVGYDVKYEYNGRTFQARLAYDPGPEMPVNIEVRPPAEVAPRAAAWSPAPQPPSYRY